MFLLWEPDLCFKWKLCSNSKDTLVGRRLSAQNIWNYKNENILSLKFRDHLRYISTGLQKLLSELFAVVVTQMVLR